MSQSVQRHHTCFCMGFAIFRTALCTDVKSDKPDARKSLPGRAIQQDYRTPGQGPGRVDQFFRAGCSIRPETFFDRSVHHVPRRDLDAKNLRAHERISTFPIIQINIASREA